MRELRGIVHMTLVHLTQWDGKYIRIFTDNAAVPKILLRGSSVLELHQLAREYIDLLARYNVKIRVIWIPRRDNMGSDLMSRQYAQALLDTKDYRLKTEIFTRLSALYGIFDIDMFANADNSLCPSYVSRLADIGSTPSCIDAFFQPHWGTAFYAFPPVDDAYLALDHILQQRDARGLLVSGPFMGTTQYLPPVFPWLMVATSFPKYEVGLYYMYTPTVLKRV